VRLQAVAWRLIHWLGNPDMAQYWFHAPVGKHWGEVFRSESIQTHQLDVNPVVGIVGVAIFKVFHSRIGYAAVKGRRCAEV